MQVAPYSATPSVRTILNNGCSMTFIVVNVAGEAADEAEEEALTSCQGALLLSMGISRRLSAVGRCGGGEPRRRRRWWQKRRRRNDAGMLDDDTTT